MASLARGGPYHSLVGKLASTPPFLAAFSISLYYRRCHVRCQVIFRRWMLVASAGWATRVTPYQVAHQGAHIRMCLRDTVIDHRHHSNHRDTSYQLILVCSARMWATLSGSMNVFHITQFTNDPSTINHYSKCIIFITRYFNLLFIFFDDMCDTIISYRE
jgi:hypothetical protein